MLLDEIAMFARVAASGTLAEAARQLGVPKSTLSRAIARLEDATGVQLVQRGARSISLTEAGRRFFAQVAPHLGALDEATLAVGKEPALIAGTLRVSGPASSGDLLGDLFVRFGARYPGIRLEIELSQRPVDLVREGFDVALRGAPKLPGDALVARKILSAELRLFASPSYVARRGAPRSAEDLTGHDLVAYSPVFARAEVPPESLGRAFAAARAATNELDLLRCMLRAGGGIGPLTATHAAADLAQGTLVRILPEWSHGFGALYVVYPAARHVPRKVAALRDFLVEALSPRGK
jgi:DNA-binding transcriptional LysR family regulator